MFIKMKAIEILKRVLKLGLENCELDVCDTFGLRDISSWIWTMWNGVLVSGQVDFDRTYVYCYTADFAEEATALITDDWDRPIWLIPVDG